MNALVIFSRPESVEAVSKCIEIAQTPRPVPGRNQILVHVKASTMQMEDLITATGRRLMSVTPSMENPITLGMEFCGEVVEAGASTEWKVGDKVMGLLAPIRLRHGCWAEYVVVKATDAARVPDDWSHVQACAFPLSCLVAHAAVECVNEESYESRVAVVGASSGVGAILTKVLTCIGVHVVGLCSENDVDFVRTCGAKEVATFESRGLVGYRRNILSGKVPQFDHVVDCMGGDTVEQEASLVLKKGGNFVTVVGPGGAFGRLDGSVGRGAAIAAKSMACRFRGKYSYTLASMSMFGIGESMQKVVEAIANDDDDENECPIILPKIVPANDMYAVRAELDVIATEEKGGRRVLDFSCFS